MLNDFCDYSKANGFDVDKHSHIIMGGKEKNTTKPFIVSTWQSLTKQTVEWNNKHQVAIIDECHLAKGTEIQSLLGKCHEAEYRVGMTGSLDNSTTNEMIIRGMLGDVKRVSATKDLMDSGHLTPIQIKSIILDYSPETKDGCKNFDYKTEISFLCQNEKRNRFMRNLALSLDKNTLLLYNLVEKHGKVLYEMIKEKAGADRPVYFVHGGVDLDDREKILKKIESHDNAIVIASLGVFSTGISINRLHNVIFASPTKSVVLPPVHQLYIGEKISADFVTILDLANPFLDNLTDFWFDKSGAKLRLTKNREFVKLDEAAAKHLVSTIFTEF